MNRYLTVTTSLMLAGLLVACGGEEEGSPQPIEEEPVEDQAEAVAPEQFAERYLAGEFERLHSQTSAEFQAQVPLQEFVQLGETFIEGVEEFQLVSEIPVMGYEEYQWISDNGDKGIRAYFAEDWTIEGLQVMPLSSHPETDEQYTEGTYRMPITGSWLTFWGGTNQLVNYHYPVESQRYAYDLVVVENGSTFEGEATNNESYHAFGKEVVAPAAGTVVSVENGIADNTPGIETNEQEPLGNHVIIDHHNGEYSVLAHFQQGSLQVSEGDQVEAGQLLGLCGNSGNSSEPHIHFHVADSAEWEEAASIRITFEDGVEPVRGEEATGFE
ncbi:M23 family metallopeptidase [Alkalihalobacillus oceani]|uniref:M23 family metallopeptidase n=1 Tax=Halalkalibacter oceani TaxID=1653776 RepID=A0A9X2IQ80_9BACI|nr:peptidoglycan DD-metalloendopeptidase family protein [Halalkalibacter oceani]MCM3715611.1 M23 family metallopeptidase [Halalkalibacter oceani]